MPCYAMKASSEGAEEIKRIDELGEIFAALDELKGGAGTTDVDVAGFEWQAPP